MKPKTIITAGLLVFVLAGLAFTVVKEFREEGETAIAKGRQSMLPNTHDEVEEILSENTSPDASHKVIAYYFHGTARCLNCMKIESFTEEAILGSFPDAIENDRLEWRVVNVQTPGNEHFLNDYQLYTKSVVLVDTRNDEEVRWKNLERVWELLHDKDSFIKYVRDEVSSYLGGD